MTRPFADPALTLYARVALAILFIAMFAALCLALAVLSIYTASVTSVVFAIAICLLDRVIQKLWQHLRGK